jgi:mono/diheme cytochrome c family protein
MRYVAVLLLTAGQLAAAELALEDRALDALKRNCVRCHGGARKFANLDLKSAKSLKDVVVPGKPEESLIIDLIEAGKMPMGGIPVGKADLATLKAWIAAGARMPKSAEKRRPK